jgi:ABC-type multidrug transport system fused ATPase/permease subunit
LRAAVTLVGVDDALDEGMADDVALVELHDGNALNALQGLAFSYHDRVNSGELISRATTDVWRLQDFLFACLLLTADIAVSLVAILTLIFLISPELGLVALLCFPFLLWLTNW